MTILSFVSQEQLDDLDDNPSIAFMQLVNHAQRSLVAQTGSLDPNDRYEWEQREELRQSFMNVVVASARRLEVEPFASMDLPRIEDFKSDHYIQFKSDLDHYITQLVIDNSLKGKKDSVAIFPKSKDSIRQYVFGLRECVEKSNMSEAKREALLAKLAQFEAELEKSRVNMVAVARVVFELLSIPGNLWASAEVAHKLTANIVQSVADAKNVENEARQIAPHVTIKELAPPRKEHAKTGSFGRQSSPMDRGKFGKSEIDDDIPF